MCDAKYEVCFDKTEFLKFKNEFGKYIKANQKWLNKM